MGISGYLWFSKSNLQKDYNKLSGENLELEKLHTELDQEYKTALQDLEDLRGDNQELNDMIENQKTELSKQKKKKIILHQSRRMKSFQTLNYRRKYGKICDF